ncbi:MAG: hypothetical protein IPG47_10145 [Thermoflexaceae bacterium]|nr:hypothetical protein [Thermoflexaceae bacterium]
MFRCRSISREIGSAACTSWSSMRSSRKPRTTTYVVTFAPASPASTTTTSPTMSRARNDTF